ncbi:hypothetical protein D3C84_1245360 [compost metagenome]
MMKIRERVEPGVAERKVNAISDSTPPSPLLSARMTNATYLTVTTRINAQNSIEMMP